MRWMVVDLALVVAGLAVLAAFGLRTAKEVGRLKAELRRASHGIRAAEEELDRVVEQAEHRPALRP
jgi:hypothetical protein